MITRGGSFPKQIYFNATNKMEVGVKINPSMVPVANAENRKIVKAGTPVTGNLQNRTTAVTAAVTAEGKSNAIGVIVHDVDITDGNVNATMCIFGWVNLDRLDTDVKALITAEVVTALDGKVVFLTDN